MLSIRVFAVSGRRSRTSILMQGKRSSFMPSPTSEPPNTSSSGTDSNSVDTLELLLVTTTYSTTYTILIMIYHRYVVSVLTVEKSSTIWHWTAPLYGSSFILSTRRFRNMQLRINGHQTKSWTLPTAPKLTKPLPNPCMSWNKQDNLRQ